MRRHAGWCTAVFRSSKGFGGKTQTVEMERNGRKRGEVGGRAEQEPLISKQSMKQIKSNTPGESLRRHSSLVIRLQAIKKKTNLAVLTMFRLWMNC